jgi:hypothetical protein
LNRAGDARIAFDDEPDAATHDIANRVRRPAGIGDDQQLDAGPVLQEFGG